MCSRRARNGEAASLMGLKTWPTSVWTKRRMGAMPELRQVELGPVDGVVHQPLQPARKCLLLIRRAEAECGRDLASDLWHAPLARSGEPQDRKLDDSASPSRSVQLPRSAGPPSQALRRGLLKRACSVETLTRALGY